MLKWKGNCFISVRANLLHHPHRFTPILHSCTTYIKPSGSTLQAVIPKPVVGRTAEQVWTGVPSTSAEAHGRSSAETHMKNPEGDFWPLTASACSNKHAHFNLMWLCSGKCLLHYIHLDHYSSPRGAQECHRAVKCTFEINRQCSVPAWFMAALLDCGELLMITRANLFLFRNCKQM